MIDWVNWHLDQALDDVVMTTQDKIDHDSFDDYLHNLGREIEAAEHGDIEPLREKMPRLAKFLYLPKRGGKGKRFSRLITKKDRTPWAADDVPRIRALWSQHYGRRRRRKNDGDSAKQIAAIRWDVDVEDVIRLAKK